MKKLIRTGQLKLFEAKYPISRLDKYIVSFDGRAISAHKTLTGANKKYDTLIRRLRRKK